MSFSQRLHTIQEQIAVAAHQAGRDPGDIRLVAVSKTRPAADIAEAYYGGQRLFGENYVQELTAKAADLCLPVEWHFIGHVQSNKVKYLAGLVSLIHSVDRLSLAEEINRQWGALNRICPILVQVNVSGESTKSGTTTADAMRLVRSISRLPHVQVQGLMTMPPFFDDPEEARPYFAQLRELSLTIAAEQIPNVIMTELSMGMSGDFVAAVQEGATLVRIGTALFGER